MENAQIDILNFDRAELATELKESLGLQPYRAQQLVQWLYKRRLTSFEGMSDISRPIRVQLAARYRIFRPKMHTVQLSNDGTRKYLFELEDGSKVETVLIKQPARYTLCVSSQVGCAIGCKFCRTGLMGLKRHLKTYEIMGQVLAVQDHIAELQADPAAVAIPDYFTNLVFMGMGEPLHNYDNVTRAVRLLNDGLGVNLSRRKITVSTSGLIPAIKKFGEEAVPASLAISLNATTDETRTQVIPINKRYPLAELLETLRTLPLHGRHRITMEYVMLHGVNDTDEDLKRMPGLLEGIPVKINLIPYNSNAGLGFHSPPREVVLKWQDRLLSLGLNATIRWSKGQDIDAACGQLATAEPRKAA